MSKKRISKSPSPLPPLDDLSEKRVLEIIGMDDTTNKTKGDDGNAKRNTTPTLEDRNRSKTPTPADSKRSKTPTPTDAKRGKTPIPGDSNRSKTPIPEDTKRSKASTSLDTKRNKTPTPEDSSRGKTSTPMDTRRSKTPIAEDSKRSKMTTLGNPKGSKNLTWGNTKRNKTSSASQLTSDRVTRKRKSVEVKENTNKKDVTKELEDSSVPKKLKTAPEIDMDDSSNQVSQLNKELPVGKKKDEFCWRCHKIGVNISCETCPRSYHIKCLKQNVTKTEHWPCPECVLILKAESTATRSTAMKEMTLEHLCELLKFAIKRMMQCPNSEHFLYPVNHREFPDYQKFIVQPMDLNCLEKNIKDNLYGSTQAFEADAKWLLHNSIIYNSYQSKLTSSAKNIIKVCKQEMQEIENCATCYLNANTKQDSWFVEVCPKPHLLVWAKLRGFPYWPAKAMTSNFMRMVDVRFFGAHDRAWVPIKDCMLFSKKDPNTSNHLKQSIRDAVKELEKHVENLKAMYGEFNYAPYKTPFDPELWTEQLQIFLPKYRPSPATTPIKIENGVQKKLDKSNLTSLKVDSTPKNAIQKNRTRSRSTGRRGRMEGYGTDEEYENDLDSERREKILNRGSEEKDISESDKSLEESIDENTTNEVPDLSKSVGGAGEVTGKPDIEKEQSKSTIKENRPLISKRKASQSMSSTKLSSMSAKISKLDVSESIEVTLVSTSKNIANTDSSGADEKTITDCVENKETNSLKRKISDRLIKVLNLSEDVDENTSQNQDKLTQTDLLLKQYQEKQANLVDSEKTKSGDIKQVQMKTQKNTGGSRTNKFNVKSSKGSVVKVKSDKRSKVLELNAKMKNTKISVDDKKDSAKTSITEVHEGPPKTLENSEVIADGEKENDNMNKNEMILKSTVTATKDVKQSGDNAKDDNACQQKSVAEVVDEKACIYSDVEIKVEPCTDEMEHHSDDTTAAIVEENCDPLAEENVDHVIKQNVNHVLKESVDNVTKIINDVASGITSPINATAPLKQKARKSFPPAPKKNKTNEPVTSTPVAEPQLPIIINSISLSDGSQITHSTNQTTPIVMLTQPSTTQTKALPEQPQLVNGARPNTHPSARTDSMSIITEEFKSLKDMIPQSSAKAFSDLMSDETRQTAAHPPSTISGMGFEKYPPSSAGPVSEILSGVSYRMTDFFRAMLTETLKDVSKDMGYTPATVLLLKQEIEQLKHQHAVEITEIKKNVCTILKDIQQSVAEERKKLAEDTKVKYEVELAKSLKEAKSKQWCANCQKEAQLYCCWNTSYCSYPCQQVHWPQHMSKCTQNSINANATASKMPQRIYLTKTVPPKTLSGKNVSKVVFNSRAGSINARITHVMQANNTTGKIAFLESVPTAAYQVISTPTGIGGKVIANNSKLAEVHPGNLSTVKTASLIPLSAANNSVVPVTTLETITTPTISNVVSLSEENNI